MSMFDDLTKTELYAFLAGIFTASLIVSNIIAGKPFAFFSFSLPSSIIIFPVIYIINDILSEIYGYEKAKKVILLGFVTNFIAVVCYNIALILPNPAYSSNSQAFSIVLGSTFRLLVAGFVAYIIGSILNSKIMVHLKSWDEDKLFFRCVMSTFFGESVDAILFITIGFFGTIPLDALLLMILVQALCKTVYEIIVYPITKRVITYIKRLPEI